MKKNSKLILNEEQKKALEKVFSCKQLVIVNEYLSNRGSNFNPWIDKLGMWLDQTDKNGHIIEGEAAERLWSNAVNNKKTLNSTYRFDPITKIRYILTNNDFGCEIWYVAKYIIGSELIKLRKVTDDEILLGELEATCNFMGYLNDNQIV